MSMKPLSTTSRRPVLRSRSASLTRWRERTPTSAGILPAAQHAWTYLPYARPCRSRAAGANTHEATKAPTTNCSAIPWNPHPFGRALRRTLNVERFQGWLPHPRTLWGDSDSAPAPLARSFWRAASEIARVSRGRTRANSPTSALVLLACSFSIMCPRWDLTVVSAVQSSRTICLFSFPARTRSSTSRSRGVKVASPASRSAFSRCRWRSTASARRASSTAPRSSAFRTGLGRKVTAPAFIARTDIPMSPCAVRKMIGRVMPRAASTLCSSRPGDARHPHIEDQATRTVDVVVFQKVIDAIEGARGKAVALQQSA